MREWGTDYLNRDGDRQVEHVRKSARRNEVHLHDDDSQGKQLNGRNIYAITFAKGQLPPVKGFWSLTLYNDLPFLQPESAETLFARHEEQEPQIQRRRFADALCRREVARQGKESNWLPAPNGTFSLYLRAYWPEKAILDGTWKPPVVKIAS